MAGSLRMAAMLKPAFQSSGLTSTPQRLRIGPQRPPCTLHLTLAPLHSTLLRVKAEASVEAAPPPSLSPDTPAPSLDSLAVVDSSPGSSAVHAAGAVESRESSEGGASKGSTGKNGWGKGQGGVKGAAGRVKSGITPSLKLRRQKDWVRARELVQSGQVWRAKVEAMRKGGALLRFGSLQAFLPLSCLESGRDATSEGDTQRQTLVGGYVTVQFLEADEKKGKLVASEREARRQMKLQEFEVGQVLEGVVRNVVDYGVFVDLLGPDGSLLGVSGLVHVSELSWDTVLSPAAFASAGKRVRARVLRVDGSKLALSIKQVQSDPLFQTLDALLPTSGTQQQRPDTPIAEELLGAPLPGLQDLCESLREQPGVEEVTLGRQALERRVVSQDLELWLSNASAKDFQFTLVARAGRQVQEVFVKTKLDRESMKQAVLKVTSSIP